jgi:hypothetical protein
MKLTPIPQALTSGRLAAALIVIGSGCGSGGAVDLGNARNHVPSAAYLPTRFPVLPPIGAEPSTPMTGRWVIDITLHPDTEWVVYADGRLIGQSWTRSHRPRIIPRGARAKDTGYVQQRLTRRGVQLLRSAILGTGLFQHNLSLVRRSHDRHQDYDGYRIRTHGRTIEVAVSPPPAGEDASSPSDKRETPAQARALARIDAIFTDPTRLLPAAAWADGAIRPWIPSHYIISYDRYAPDPSRLPPPANAALAQYTKLLSTSVQIVTTNQARALLQAFKKAGIAPARNTPAMVLYDFAGLHMRPGLLTFSRAFPGEQQTP